MRATLGVEIRTASGIPEASVPRASNQDEPSTSVPLAPQVGPSASAERMFPRRRSSAWSPPIASRAHVSPPAHGAGACRYGAPAGRPPSAGAAARCALSLRLSVVTQASCARVAVRLWRDVTMLQTWIEICKRREDETGLEWRVRVCRRHRSHFRSAPRRRLPRSALGTRTEERRMRGMRVLACFTVLSLSRLAAHRREGRAARR